MGDTTLTGAAGANVLSVQRPTELFNVNARRETALDNSSVAETAEPTDFFTPSSLNNRASDLFRLQDTVTSSVRSLQNAQDSLSNIRGLVDQAETIARDALSLQSETASVQSSVTEIDGTETLEQAFNLDAGDSITVGDGAQTLTVEADGATTVNGLVSAINSDESLGVRASVTNSSLTLEAVGENPITATVNDNGGEANSISDIGFTDLGDGVVAEAGSLSLNRLGLSNDFNAVLEQIDQVARDAGSDGVNLLQGDSFTERFGPNNEPTITVTGGDFDSEGLGINTTFSNFQTDVDIREAITELDAAAVEVDNQSAIFGANETAIDINQGFSTGLISALQSGTNLNVENPDEQIVGVLAQQTQQLIAAESEPLTSDEDQEILRNIE